MHESLHSRRPCRAAIVTAVAASLFAAGCFPELPLGTPGHWDYQSLGVIEVPGAIFNAAALNTRFEHEAFSIDTKVGPRKTFEQVYNTGTRQWRASWEMSYDGTTFVDHLGTVHDLQNVPFGTAIPGSYWVVVDADTVKTKGGLTYHFDGAGRLAVETWSRDDFPQLFYAWDASSVRVEECVSASQKQNGQCRLIATVSYGPEGPVEIVDEVSAAAGETRRATYSYDGSGRVLEARTARQEAGALPGTRYEYDEVSRLRAQVLPEGERIEYVYAQTHLYEVRQVGEGDPTHRFDYYGSSEGSHEIVHTSPVGGRTQYTVASEGRVTRIERLDLAQPEVMTVDWQPGLRRPSEIRSFDGTLRRFPTWVDDDPTTVVESSGNTLVYTYEPGGIHHANATQRPVAQITDDLGPVLSVDYDPATGLPLQQTNGEGETTTFVHLGQNLVESTAPWGVTTEVTSFAAAGHWRNATVSSFPEVTIKRRFDLVGNLVVPAAGLQLGGVLEQRYDRDRRLQTMEVAATDEDGLMTTTDFVTFDLRGDGQVLAIERPLGANHEFEYDTLGRAIRICERVEGVCRDTLLEYDASGRQTAIERANGMREEVDYDPYGRVIAHRAYQDGVLYGEATFTWQDGHLVATTDSVRDETRTLTYEPGTGRLQTQTFSAHGETHVLDYDARSRVIGEAFVVSPSIGGGDPTVRVIGYDYDLADRQVRVYVDDGSPEGDLLREWEIQDGRIVLVRDGNGNERETLFDAQTNERVGFEMRDPGGLVLEDTTITKSVETGPSRLQVRTETVTALATTEEEYWLNRPGSLLDPNGKVGMRIFRARGWDDGVLTHDRRYAWDALSNIANTGDTFVYNADRTRLLQADGAGWSHTYQYDEAGYVTSRDGLEIGWTATGRVARVGPAATPLVEAAWDLSGGLVSVDADGEYREFTWFGGRVEHDPAAGGPGWLHIGGVSLPFTGSARRYRHADFRGNASVVAGETGAIVSHRRYGAFGLDQVHGTSGSGGSSLLEQLVLSGFAGGVAAEGLGLSFNGARVLDTDTGRFLSPDPLLQDVNQVTYANGNPIFFEDRDGKEAAPNSAGLSPAGTLALGAAALGVGVALGGVLVAVGVGGSTLAFVVALGAVDVSVLGGAAIVLGLLQAWQAKVDNNSNPGQGKDLHLEGDVTAIQALSALGIGSVTASRSPSRAPGPSVEMGPTVPSLSFSLCAPIVRLHAGRSAVRPLVLLGSLILTVTSLIAAIRGPRDAWVT